MSSLSIASLGYLPNRTTLGVASDGLLYSDDVGAEIEEIGGSASIAAFLLSMRQQVARDIEDRDFRKKEKFNGKKTPLITAKKVLREAPKGSVAEKAAEIAAIANVSRKEARAILEARADIEILMMKLKRIKDLNDETLKLILITVATLDEF